MDNLNLNFSHFKPKINKEYIKKIIYLNSENKFINVLGKNSNNTNNTNKLDIQKIVKLPNINNETKNTGL